MIYYTEWNDKEIIVVETLLNRKLIESVVRRLDAWPPPPQILDPCDPAKELADLTAYATDVFELPPPEVLLHTALSETYCIYYKIDLQTLAPTGGFCDGDIVPAAYIPTLLKSDLEREETRPDGIFQQQVNLWPIVGVTGLPSAPGQPENAIQLCSWKNYYYVRRHRLIEDFFHEWFHYAIRVRNQWLNPRREEPLARWFGILVAERYLETKQVDSLTSAMLRKVRAESLSYAAELSLALTSLAACRHLPQRERFQRYEDVLSQHANLDKVHAGFLPLNVATVVVQESSVCLPASCADVPEKHLYPKELFEAFYAACWEE